MVMNGVVGPRTVFVNGAGNQFFTRAALSGDQDAAGLRRDRLNHVEDGAHLGTLSYDVVQTGQPADFTSQGSRPLSSTSDFQRLHGRPHAIDLRDRGP